MSFNKSRRGDIENAPTVQNPFQKRRQHSDGPFFNNGTVPQQNKGIDKDLYFRSKSSKRNEK